MNMKTKNVLFALCLPIAFTACQNEEFVKDYSQELKNRGEIDVILSASYPKVGNSVDTRMSAEESGNSLSFLWEQTTDKLGAAMMDEENAGTVNGAAIYNNYPFIAQSSGATSTFASPSSITKGIYLFYNSYKDVLDREALSLSLQTQEYDPTSAKTPAQQMAKYMNMVAPMVNLNEGIKLADAAAFNLPLEFVNLYTPVKVPVQFKNAPEGTKLTRITINGGSDFVLGGKLNPKVLAGELNANVLTVTDGIIDATKMAKAKETIETIVQAGSAAAGIYTTTNEDLVKGAAELSIKGGMALENDKAQNFWILIPRGKYTTLKINAETTNGNMTEKIINVPASTDPEAKNPQDFTSETRVLSTIELNFNAGGNVEQPYEFTINSTTDWNNYIQYVKDHLESYIGRDIIFNIGAGKSVYVTSLPTFGFTLAGGDSDSKLILGKEDKTAVTAQLDLSGITMGSNVNFVVGEGAVVTLSKVQKSGTVASLTNNGTLTVGAIDNITALTNNKTLNFKSSAALTVPNVENVGEATIKVQSETTFTVFTNEAKANITVDKDATLSLPGTANAGMIVNKGTLNNANGFTNNGTIDNFGTLAVTTTFTNSGKIIARDGSESNNAAITNINGTVEVINPTTYAVLAGGKQYNVSGGTTTAIVTNRGDFNAANTASISITLGGGEWAIVADASQSADASRELAATEITADLSLQADLNVKETADLNSRIFTVTGASTIKAAEKKTLTIKSLVVAQGVTATITAGAEVIIPNEDTSGAKIEVKGTLNNNGTLSTPEVAAAVTAVSGVKVFAIEVASGATLTNKGTIGGEQNTQAKITVNGNLDNGNGTIYGASTIDNAEYYKKGTVHKLPKILANAADLTGFVGATEIEAVTTAVTTIPQNTKIKVGVESVALALADGSYGELTFTAASTISASSISAVVSKITVDAVALTVGGSNDITCNDFVKENSGSLVDDSSHLKDADGAVWISK